MWLRPNFLKRIAVVEFVKNVVEPRIVEEKDKGKHIEDLQAGYESFAGNARNQRCDHKRWTTTCAFYRTDKIYISTVSRRSGDEGITLLQVCD